MSNDVVNTQTPTPPLTALDAEKLAAAGPAGQDIYRERVQWTGSILAEVAEVKNAVPLTTAYAGVVRPIPRLATAGAPVGIIVSTAAILVQASNVNRKSITITNNSTVSSLMYLGITAGVTSSGAAMGILLLPGGSYNDSGDGIYTGDIFAIGTVVSVIQSLSSWERT